MRLDVVDSVIAAKVNLFEFLLTFKLGGQMPFVWVPGIAEEI